MAVPSPTKAAAIVRGAPRRGYGQWVWIPGATGIANPASPTSAEITAGTDYAPQIGDDPDGFDLDPSTIDFGNAGNRVIPKIVGQVTLNDGTLMFNCSNDPTVTDARTVFNDGSDGSTTPTVGFWVDAPNKLVTSAKIRVYAATVNSATLSTGLDDALRLRVNFALSFMSGFITVPTA